MSGRADVGGIRDVAATARALARRERWMRRKPWPGFGEAFNGQRLRQETVKRIAARLQPDVCIETGTFMGFTTRALAELGHPVITIEVDPGYHRLAAHSLRDLHAVEAIRGDSAEVLRQLAGRPIARPLLYLDAHWGERVPLSSELEVTFGAWAETVVVIDDFRVPHDPGYGYDIYGGVPLSAEQYDFPDGATLAYPAAPAIEETGSRRGTLYIGTGGTGGAAVAQEVAAGALTPAG
jgi:predicted O-methyltransferase YrrM